LDSKAGAEVVNLMKRMNDELGITFILVTHNPEVANVAERIIYLRDGQISHEEIIP
jgi:putative ABC transport system ATP-binding protein